MFACTQCINSFVELFPLHCFIESTGVIANLISKNEKTFTTSVINETTDDVPIIYMITPTFTRPTQKADLTRLCQTLMLVHNLHWIVVEDTVSKTSLVTHFLARLVK